MHPLLNQFPESRKQSFQTYFHPDCLLHEGPPEHPERPERLQAVLEGCLALPPKTPVAFVIPTPASFEQLLWIHDRNYLNRLEESTYSTSSFMSPDNFLCMDSWDAIRASAGCAIATGEWLAKGKSSFALTRPPGHHASRETAEGFCFINNVALAVECVRNTHPNAKCLIVDFDVHHGNGIDRQYAKDSKVLYYSIHGNPAHIYPHSGFPDETGLGKGIGTTCNVTVDEGMNGPDWFRLFQTSLTQFAREHRPEYLFVSAGFDAHEEDPFSLLKVKDREYLQAVAMLQEIAGTYCNGHSAWFLEGGYSTTVLKRLVPKVIAKLAQ